MEEQTFYSFFDTLDEYILSLNPEGDDNDDDYEIEKLVAEDVVDDRELYLVKWKGRTEDESTWEHRESLGFYQPIHEFEERKQAGLVIPEEYLLHFVEKNGVLQRRVSYPAKYPASQAASPALQASASVPAVHIQTFLSLCIEGLRLIASRERESAQQIYTNISQLEVWNDILQSPPILDKLLAIRKGKHMHARQSYLENTVGMLCQIHCMFLYIDEESDFNDNELKEILLKIVTAIEIKAVETYRLYLHRSYARELSVSELRRKQKINFMEQRGMNESDDMTTDEDMTNKPEWYNRQKMKALKMIQSEVQCLSHLIPDIERLRRIYWKLHATASEES